VGVGEVHSDLEENKELIRFFFFEPVSIPVGAIEGKSLPIETRCLRLRN
jgi:hypothetical protein